MTDTRLRYFCSDDAPALMYLQFVSGGGDDKGFLWTIKDDGAVGGSCELGG